MAEYVEEEDEEVSDEEKVAIVQHFLLNSPPGEFDEVKGDALALVQDGLVSDSMLAGICRAYNKDALRIVDLEEGRKMVLCDASEIDATTYLDPRTGDSYSVDHATLAATKLESEGSPPTAASALGEERTAIEAAVSEYVAAQYAGNACAGTFADDTDAIKVVVSGEKLNLRNYWSGNWRSTWTVEVRGTEAFVSGNMKVRAHYFEDGNVQLQTSKDVPPTTASFADASQIGPAVADIIQQAESELQQGLEDMYSNMSHETFKAMRRVMPITRTKMKWNIHEIALNRNLRK